MRNLSQSVNYAFRAMALLDGPEGRLQGVEHLSKATGTPGPFLGKVLQALQRADLVESMRGRNGGFRLTRSAGEITLAAVVDVLDGPQWRTSCLLGLGQCSGHTDCAALTCCHDMGERLTSELTRLTIRDLAGILRLHLEPGA